MWDSRPGCLSVAKGDRNPAEGGWATFGFGAVLRGTPRRAFPKDVAAQAEVPPP